MRSHRSFADIQSDVYAQFRAREPYAIALDMPVYAEIVSESGDKTGRRANIAPERYVPEFSPDGIQVGAKTVRADYFIKQVTGRSADRFAVQLFGADGIHYQVKSDVLESSSSEFKELMISLLNDTATVTPPARAASLESAWKAQEEQERLLQLEKADRERREKEKREVEAAAAALDLELKQVVYGDKHGSW
ncbi:hypothetical protein [Chromobacterium phragmitis]|uniref:Defence against restriction A N-terminal domain-containing protein n=1 Tax=Chromobacterium phragmitis TaxID=2202141 RepID=A0ABV0J0Y7_9NEIS